MVTTGDSDGFLSGNIAKRIFDVCVAGLGLLLLSPIIIVLAFCVLVFVGRPIIFAQARPGLGGRPFTIWKFRTMTLARSDDGELLPDNERVTRFGRFLRASSLDELPELVNILRGDMSLVGPRPLLMEYLPLYTAEQARRHDIRPGITGWAQVKGRNELSWEEKFELDLWYVNNQSFLLDLRIILLTIVKVLKGEGISHPGESTMHKFTGSRASDGL
jgi:lipopolysaccharide/colanic/teichoic acid biosynthesis glycosyltransferase